MSDIIRKTDFINKVNSLDLTLAEEAYKNIKGMNFNVPDLPKGLKEKYMNVSNELVLYMKPEQEKLISMYSVLDKKNERAVQLFTTDANNLYKKYLPKRQQIDGILLPPSSALKPSTSNVESYEKALAQKEAETFKAVTENKAHIPDQKIVSYEKIELEKAELAELIKAKDRANLEDGLTTIFDKGSDTITRRKVVEILKNSEGRFTLENGRVKVDLALAKIKSFKFASELKTLLGWMPKSANATDPQLVVAGEKVLNASKGILKTLGKYILVLMGIEFAKIALNWRSELQAVEVQNRPTPNETATQKAGREARISLLTREINQRQMKALIETQTFGDAGMTSQMESMTANPVDIEKTELDKFLEDMSKTDLSADRAIEIINKFELMFR
jgi:hypothetical protein